MRWSFLVGPFAGVPNHLGPGPLLEWLVVRGLSRDQWTPPKDLPRMRWVLWWVLLPGSKTTGVCHYRSGKLYRALNSTLRALSTTSAGPLFRDHCFEWHSIDALGPPIVVFGTVFEQWFETVGPQTVCVQYIDRALNVLQKPTQT